VQNTFEIFISYFSHVCLILAIQQLFHHIDAACLQKICIERVVHFMVGCYSVCKVAGSHPS